MMAAQAGHSVGSVAGSSRGGVVASSRGGGVRGGASPVTCVARRASSAARVGAAAGTQQRRNLASSLAPAFGAGAGGGGCLSIGGRRSRLSLATPPRAKAEEEDWESLFANLKPLVPTLPHYKVRASCTPDSHSLSHSVAITLQLLFS